MVLTGSFALTGTDAKGTHSLSGPVDCMQIDPANGAVLAHQTTSSGEPASVYGVLCHVTDPEDQGTNTGTGDKVDVTMLNQKQYQRALTSGCSAAAGKQSLTAGNITVDVGLGGIIIIPCPPFCGLPL
jgi:hypothetical protein